jgi:hypothetical protein
LYKYPTDSLEETANHYQKEVKDLKLAAAHILKEGKMDEKTLKLILNRIERLSHKAGHCRGEKYIKDNFRVEL